MLDRILSPLAERWAWVGTALRVQKRFGELHGSSLAAAVTLSAFLAVFPLLLVTIAVVGWFSSQGENLALRIVEQLGLTGRAGDVVRSTIESAERSRRFATILGLAGGLWTGLGLVAALQQALNSVWQAPGQGLKGRLYGLLWLAGAGVLMLGSFAVTAAMQTLPGPAWPAVFLGSVTLGVVLWLWTLHTLCNRDVGWKPLLPGAVLGAVGMEVLHVVGGVYVPRAVAQSSALYGSLGVVFALLAWLFFFGRLVVYAAVLNVVRWEEEHGTVTAEIEVPRLPGAVPLVTSRSGEVVEQR